MINSAGDDISWYLQACSHLSLGLVLDWKLRNF